jgi:2-polyprenyl-3-methyl-5-hydroxy-6-metoxy-1,4-benzoquinol methylase
MKEIEQNKKAWALIAEDHYKTFKHRLEEEHSLLNNTITAELGEISGKRLIHLQCNTGADSISLARMGANVTGVDLVPDNIKYARRLARDFDIERIDFFEADIMRLMDHHHEKYDIVFTSEGAVGWLPDLKKWGRTIRHLLKDDGFFYVMDLHPFYLTLDEDGIGRNDFVLKYPYFQKDPDVGKTIGGYASERKEAKSYYWMYTIGDIINSLTSAGLCINFFHEFDKLFFKLGDMQKVEKGFYRNPFFRDKLPFTFSLMAEIRK